MTLTTAMRGVTVAYVLAVLLVAAGVWLTYNTFLVGQSSGKGGLRIAVTFPSLLEDVKALACEDDAVEAIAPAGVDPHEYQLTPQDLALLRESDLIVSTGHAPFEMRIAELVQKGEIKARLIEIPSIPGIKLLKNPATGQPNYHMPILDPSNYLVFIRNLTDTMIQLRPACAASYRERSAEIERRVNSLVAEAPRLNVTALAQSPVAQYYLEWLGVRVKYLLIREHDLPSTPEDVAAAEKALASGEVQLVVSVKGTEGTPLGSKAQELASRYQVPILYVPSPSEPGGVLLKIEEVVEDIKSMKK